MVVLDDTPEQALLRESIRAVTDRCSAAGRDDTDVPDAELESGLAELGLIDAVVDDGVGLVELGCVFEECGRAAVGGPFLHALTGYLLARVVAGATAAQELRERVATSVTWADLDLGRGANGSRTGRVLLPWGHLARTAVLLEADAGRVRLLDLEPASSSPGTGVDGEPVVAIEVPGLAGWAGDTGEGDPERMRGLPDLLWSAYLLGLAASMLDLAVAHTSERRQFGVPIGSFQSVQHQLAQIRIQLSGTRLAVYEELWSGTRDATVPGRWAVAKYQTLRATEASAHASAQFHGGIGFTREYGLHRYFSRAKATALRLGGTQHSLTQVAHDLLGTGRPIALRRPPAVSRNGAAR